MINVQNVPSALFILYLELKESKALHRTNQYTRVMVYAFGVHTGKALFWFFPPDLGDPYMPRGKNMDFRGIFASSPSTASSSMLMAWASWTRPLLRHPPPLPLMRHDLRRRSVPRYHCVTVFRPVRRRVSRTHTTWVLT